VLPTSFLVPDAQRMITAIDTGLMSTAVQQETPLHYIKGGVGVLFVLHCTRADATTGDLAAPWQGGDAVPAPDDADGAERRGW
jgi:hypothetical protein